MLTQPESTSWQSILAQQPRINNRACPHTCSNVGLTTIAPARRTSWHGRIWSAGAGSTPLWSCTSSRGRSSKPRCTARLCTAKSRHRCSTCMALLPGFSTAYARLDHTRSQSVYAAGTTTGRVSSTGPLHGHVTKLILTSTDPPPVPATGPAAGGCDCHRRTGGAEGDLWRRGRARWRAAHAPAGRRLPGGGRAGAACRGCHTGAR